MKILAIETSADATGIAILEANIASGDIKFKVLANKIHTQIDIHTGYGGIYPMVAKREHGKNIIPTITAALQEARMLKKGTKIDQKINDEIAKILERERELSKTFVEFIDKIEKPDLDAIAVTVGPGLEPTLWVGISFARALALAWNIPIIPVNHMEGHLLSSLVQKKKTFTYSKKTLRFPVLSLLISGGHTELVVVKEFGKYEIIGETLDDAAGEAFDKVARMLLLPYPGGPEISRLAEKERIKEKQDYKGLRSAKSARTEKFSTKKIAYPNNLSFSVNFPRPMIKSKNFDFSFSGLKTAVLYHIRDNGPLTPKKKSEIAKEFEDAVVDVLAFKTLCAIQTHKIKTLVLGGGVSGNIHLKRVLKKQVKELDKNISIHFPTQTLSTDNALMIAIAGYFQYKKNKFTKSENLKADGNLRL